MKSIIGLLTLLCLGWQLSLHGQATVDITGTIKTPLGATQGATVTFISTGDEFLGNCVSGPDGKFKSQYKIQIGKTIKISVTANGYDVFERTFTVDKTGNAGEIMLKRKMITISGIVRDSITEAVLQGVEVFYYDGSKQVQTKSTNNQGYFEIEINFNYGQKISVRVTKSGCYDKEQTMTIANEGRNTLADFLLPQFGDRGLRAFITVVDKKKGKPLGGATVRYLDRRKTTYRDTVVSSKGDVELKLYQQPGTVLELVISKANYTTRTIHQTLSTDPSGNTFTYELEKGHKSTGTLLLIGAGATALASGALYLSSNSLYESYKDFENPHREEDYDAAQSRRNLSLATGVAAAGFVVAYIVYKASAKKKEKKAEEAENNKTSYKRFSLFSSPYVTNSNYNIGLVYHF